MQSPRDPRAALVREELRPGLSGFRCPSTGGMWIDGGTYWDWLRAQPGFPKPIPATAGAPVSDDNDSDEALISPRSGRLMQKFRVGMGLDFRVDFDASSRGFWLDRDEYETLASRNMHDELHLICSPEYQKKLIEMQSQSSMDKRLEQLLGEDGCSRIEEFAAWLTTQDSQSIALAYLNACLERFE